MVTIQNTATPSTARTATRITSLRSMRRSMPEGRRVPRDGRPSVPVPRMRSALALAVGLVTSAAVLLHLGELRLERVEILRGGLGRLGFVGELRQLGVEIGLVLPDRRQCRRVAPRLRTLRKQRVHLGDLLVGGENQLRLGEIERLLALRHLAAEPGLLAVGLHDGLAGGNRILLGGDGGHAERNGSNRKHSADDHVVSLMALFRSGPPLRGVIRGSGPDRMGRTPPRSGYS